MNTEQIELRTQQLLEAQVGSLVLMCARLRAEREAIDALLAKTQAELAALKAELPA